MYVNFRTSCTGFLVTVSGIVSDTETNERVYLWLVNLWRESSQAVPTCISYRISSVQVRIAWLGWSQFIRGNFFTLHRNSLSLQTGVYLQIYTVLGRNYCNFLETSNYKKLCNFYNKSNDLIYVEKNPSVDGIVCTL